MLCMLCLWISCDPSNGSLCFFSQIVDRLEIFVWVCGLCVLVGCAETGGHSHLGRFLGRSMWGLNGRLVGHTELFRYANFAQNTFWCADCAHGCKLRSRISRPTHFGRPWKQALRSTEGFRSTELKPRSDLRFLIRSTG